MLRKMIVGICLLVIGVSVGYLLRRNSETSQSPPEVTNGPVLVATVDIQMWAPLDPLIAQGKFVVVLLPKAAILPDAVTDVSQLQGMYASVPIYQNEQIPVVRLSHEDCSA